VESIEEDEDESSKPASRRFNERRSR